MDNNQCKFFVQRKKRYCRMTVKQGEEYCGEHKPTNSDTKRNDLNEEIRIICPLDSTHTCFAHKLKQHLKKCNARPKQNIPYIEKGINNDNKIEKDQPKKRALINYSNTQILNVINKVYKVYEAFIKDKITSKEILHESLKEELENPEYGHTTRKHLLQTASLLGILNSYDLVRPDTCFVEFGAGKGKLSYWLAKSIENVPNASVVLIERASPRHKSDNKLEKDNYRIQRVRVDIADLVLNKIESVKQQKNIVGITKHLCGEATDLTLRCLMNASDSQVVLGMLLSLCCHHRCHWQNYVGKSFFKNIGLTEDDFDIMCCLAGWAVCGTGTSRDKKHTCYEEYNNRRSELGFNLLEREGIGKRCKHIIDWGRKVYLEEQFFKTELHYYVKPDISLENLCIIAVKEAN